MISPFFSLCVYAWVKICVEHHTFPHQVCVFINHSFCLGGGVRLLLCVRHIYKWGPWSLLLTSLLAENNRGSGKYKCFDNLWKKTLVLKDETIARCWVVSTHVPRQKHEVKQWRISQKQLTVCLVKQLSKLSMSTRTGENRMSVCFLWITVLLYCKCSLKSDQ